MSSEALGSLRLSRRVQAHLSLARISNSPTVASNVLAGAAIGGALSLSTRTLLLMVAMVLFYTAGMYLNDLLDYRIDLRERPERPLPSGTVSRGEATTVTVLLFAAGLGLLALVSVPALLGGVALTTLIVVYDLWHKTNPLSPVLMAGTRMLVYLIAALAFTPVLTPSLMLWMVLLGLYIVGLTSIAKTERRPGLTRYWPAVLLVLPAVYFAVSMPSVSLGTGLPLFLLFLGWTAYSLSFLYWPARRDVGRTVGSLIAGVSLVDAQVLLLQVAPLYLLLLALAAFALTLFWQRFIKGT